MTNGLLACPAATIAPAMTGAEALAWKREGMHRRRISPEAGRALEILGHAIEYLADEYAYRAECDLVYDGRVEAMQLLMRVNRGIYLACPEAPTLAERCRTLLHLRAA